MCAKVLDMADRYGAKGLVLAGGVAANALLRQEVTRRSPPARHHSNAQAVHRQRGDDRRLRLLPVPAG